MCRLKWCKKNSKFVIASINPNEALISRIRFYTFHGEKEQEDEKVKQQSQEPPTLI
jgi:hypothetical protein